jgi:hypothetical protein
VHTQFVVVGVHLSDKEKIGEIFEAINFKLQFTNQSYYLRNFMLKRPICLNLNENR